MKNYLKYFFIFGFFVFKSASANDLTPNAPLEVRADFWCPYNCKANTDFPGYMIEIMNEAFGKKNIHYEELNWARALKETRDGKIDAVVGISEKNSADFIYSKKAIGHARNCFYTKSISNWTYKNIQSLEAVRLGVIQDYTYFPELDRYINLNKMNMNKVQFHPGNDALIRMLQKMKLGRIDVIVEDPNVVSYALKYYPKFDDIKRVGCYDSGPLYIAFSRSNPKSETYSKILDEEYERMKSNGKLNKLLEKYSVEKWEK